ncbi:hypothetical protein [Paraburkholderia sp. BCC1886]|uniref:hypothetical protein n=1 Tax=Paraburkholderia sp. BCC1886 TaxID=2562670 RepID=UPI0011828587|nr:hypothetical protein [Paraburkholderia sp. BCC1886]
MTSRSLRSLLTVASGLLFAVVTPAAFAGSVAIGISLPPPVIAAPAVPVYVAPAPVVVAAPAVVAAPVIVAAPVVAAPVYVAPPAIGVSVRAGYWGGARGVVVVR